LIYIGQNISGLGKKDKSESSKETLNSPNTLNRSTNNINNLNQTQYEVSDDNIYNVVFKKDN
jgi:hypothetical protein